MDSMTNFHRVMVPVPVHEVRNDKALICCIVFALLISLGMYLVYRIFSESNWAYHPEDPVDIAEKRFAMGEITKTQLAEIRKELER